MVEVNKASETRKARIEAECGQLSNELQTSTEESASQRPYFTFYRSFRDAISKLPENEQLSIYKAIADFALDGVEPDGEVLCGIGGVIWELVRPNLVASWRKFEAGKKGGAPLGNRNNPQGNNQWTSRGQAEDKQRTSNKDKDKREIEKDIEKDNIKVEGKPQPQTAKRFSPPSIVEVDSYIKEMGYANVDAQQFCDYYNSIGWMVGKSPMKDWQSALRNWQRRTNNTQNSKTYANNIRDHKATSLLHFEAGGYGESTL